MTPGKGAGPNNQRGTKYESFFKNLEEIKKQNLLPCIVFFFSKAQVEALANEVSDTMTLATGSERSRIM